MKERQDAWQEQDDLTLAETVLSHIRSGSTQLSAFEVASEKLNRTSAACGFRWNSEVRKRYENEIAEAKTQRKEAKKKLKVFIGDEELKPDEELAVVSNTQPEKQDKKHPATDYIEQIVTAANGLRQQHVNMVRRIETLSEELQQAMQEIQSLKHKLVTEAPETVASDDYQALLQILSRARSLGALDKLSS